MVRLSSERRAALAVDRRGRAERLVILGGFAAIAAGSMVAESQVVRGGTQKDLKPLTTLQSLGSAKLPWLVAINPSSNSVAIGSCQAVYIDLKDEFGKETPRNPTGMRVSMQDFDWTASGGQGVAAVGVYNGASSWSVCACQAAVQGATINVTAVYPARSLPEKARVKGLAFRSYIELPIAPARGTFNPPGCDQLTTTTVAISVPPADPPDVGRPRADDVSPPRPMTPPTQTPPTQAPPTQAPPTQAPPTQAPPSQVAPEPETPAPAAPATPALPAQPIPLTGGPNPGLPAPSGIVAVGTPSRAKLTWHAGRGARSYSVRRWSTLNADCCRNSVSGLTSPTWDDANFPLAGAYMFEITTTYADGQTRSATISYTRPDPVNPAGFAARQSGEGTVTLSWQAVPDVSFYRLWGPGIAHTGVSIPGTTHQVTGIAAGAHEWTVASFYVPGPVSTAGTLFSKTSLQMMTSTVAAAPPVPSPAASPPAASPPASNPPSSTGRYRVVANGFRVLHETKDHALSLDGHGDEVYGAFAMFHFDRRTSKLLDQDLRKTKNIGETGASDPTRLKGGTWTAKGGFRAGDVFPAVADPAKRYGAQPTDVSFPFLVWSGTLTDGQNALLLLPTMWEYDGNEGGYDKWFANEMSEVSRIWSDQAVQGAVAGTSLALMTPPGTVETSFGPHINVGTMNWGFNGLGPLPALLNSSFDRPIGSGISGVGGTSGLASGVVLPRRAIVITREIVETALAKLAQSAAVGPAMLAPAAPGFPAPWVPGVPAGTIAVPLFERGSVDLQGVYVLYLQVERVP